MSAGDFVRPTAPTQKGNNMVAAIRMHWLMIVLVAIGIWFFLKKR